MNFYKTPLRTLVVAFLLLTATNLSAQEQVVTPDSGIKNSQDAGSKARTHFKILVPSGGHEHFNAQINAQATPFATAPTSGYGYQTPSSIACIYGLVPSTFDCNPNQTTNNVPSNTVSGTKVIAVVVAYHYPNALADLTGFSTQFGLPTPQEQTIYVAGTQPVTSPYNWELEAALDLQWAHAMAPSAKLILVEAASSSISDLLNAVSVATTQVQQAGGGIVSMSWGTSEFSTESSYESYFNNPGVVYFASSGDASGTSWPCVSQNVVCVGGTTLRLNNTNTSNSNIGDFIDDVAWEYGGGGISTYVPSPRYQKQLNLNSSNGRGIPDVALAADPTAGAWVFYSSSDTNISYWFILGGTSWASPLAAGITANSKAITSNSSSSTELAHIYNSNSFSDITIGWCGAYFGLSAKEGWDQCTGVGSYKGR